VTSTEFASRFDVARTPYRRVLESAHLTEEAKQELTTTYLELTPAELKRQIGRCQDWLLAPARTKSDRGREVTPPGPALPGDVLLGAAFEDIFGEAIRDPSRTSDVRQQEDAGGRRSRAPKRHPHASIKPSGSQRGRRCWALG
jgi:hypothetical protein